ncbi:MAG: tetratricopeptide repeat protein [bacterium]|nr:tetratricopeptide repeat protein [bacterium]
MQAFKRLQESYPDTDVSIQAHGDIGNIWRALGTPQKALTAFQAYEAKIESPSEKSSARLQIARIYEDLRWDDLASDSFRQLIAGPDLSRAGEGQFGLARIMEKSNQTQQALREYRTYLKDYADGPLAETAESRIRLLEDFYIPTSEENTWIELFTSLPVISGDADSRFQLGKSFYNRRIYDRAVAHLEAALELGKTANWAPEAIFLLGQSHVKLAEKSSLEKAADEAKLHTQQSFDRFKQVVELFPGSDWTDDAVLATIGAETAALPDSVRALRQRTLYTQFQVTYPQSDRLADSQLRIADTYLATNDIQAAYKIFLSVASSKADPEILERATYGIGLCQTRLGDHAKAESTLRDFLFEHPQSAIAPLVRFQLGQILLSALKFYASAAEEFSELLAAPSSLKLERASRSYLAECYFQMEDYQKAIAIDEILLRREPTPDLLRRLAKSYFNDNQHDKAVATFAQFLRKFPTAADADSIAFTRGERLAYLNRIPEAINAFLEFSSRYKASPLKKQADQAIGDLYFQTERYGEAVTAYQQIPKPSQNETVAGRTVLSLYRLRRIKEADKNAGDFKKDYKTAVEWLSQFEVEKGKYELAIKNPKKARQIFEDVIKNAPLSEAKSEASYYIIRSFHDEGPDKEGNNDPYHDALTQFVKNFPDSPHWVDANLELAKFWEANEEYASSATYYRNALNKGVDKALRPDILYALSQNFNYLKSWDVGIDYARQLVQEFPQHKRAVDARLNIAQMLQFKGDFEASNREFLPLLKLATSEDERASIHYSIGENYFKMGDYNNARREFFTLNYNTKISTNWIASALVMISECHTEQGEYEQGIAALEQVKVRFGATSSFGLSAEDRIRKLNARGRSNILSR